MRGKVAEVLVLEDRVWVLAFHERDTEREAAVYVERTPAAECIEYMDEVEWSGDYFYWTPKSGAFNRYVMTKLGKSGALRPSEDEVVKDYGAVI